MNKNLMYILYDDYFFLYWIYGFYYLMKFMGKNNIK